MTFDATEQSNQDGKPVALYEFRLGTKFWRYTSADREITSAAYRGSTAPYSPAACTDSGMTVGGQESQDDFKVTIQSDAEIVTLFRGTPPLDSVWLTVRRLHQSDPDLASVVHWVGTVSSVKKVDAASSDVTCNTLGISFARGGLRLGWEKNCPHMLFGPGCNTSGLNAEDFAVPATVTALTGNSISCPEIALMPAHYFDGGFMAWRLDDDTPLRRGLVGDAGVTVVSAIATPDIQNIPRLLDVHGADIGPDYQTLVDSLYNGEVRPFIDETGDDDIHYFRRIDYDPFTVPTATYKQAEWQLIFQEQTSNTVALYEWVSGTAYDPTTDGFGGSDTVSDIGDHNPSITVLGTTDGLKIGTRIKLYPGCDRTTGANGCTKFANTNNFGGFPQLSRRSPFDGNPVF